MTLNPMTEGMKKTHSNLRRKKRIFNSFGNNLLLLIFSKAFQLLISINQSIKVNKKINFLQKKIKLLFACNILYF